MDNSRMTLAGAHGGSRPDRWLVPHQALDPCARRMTYGPIRPMDWTGRPFWQRLLGRG